MHDTKASITYDGLFGGKTPLNVSYRKLLIVVLMAVSPENLIALLGVYMRSITPAPYTNRYGVNYGVVPDA